MSSNVCIAFLRMHLLETMPSSLPKLLNAVKWSHHRDVSVVSYNNIVCTYINALCMCGYYVKLGCKNLRVLNHIQKLHLHLATAILTCSRRVPWHILNCLVDLTCPTSQVATKINLANIYLSVQCWFQLNLSGL